jgi:hypothetical protein
MYRSDAFFLNLFIYFTSASCSISVDFLLYTDAGLCLSASCSISMDFLLYSDAGFMFLH